MWMVKVIMYADKITNSMQKSIDTTNARRERQHAYNEANGIEPRSIQKSVRDLTDDLVEEEMVVAEAEGTYTTLADLPKHELHQMIQELEKQMKTAAQNLEFEKAAQLRDQIVEMRPNYGPQRSGRRWRYAGVGAHA